eukprot:NODE_194_length_15414_cov_0.324127.p10 type:complete len:181 gc:universal NODE_194_length_15414_cov_0.324127:11486-12028(+)
MDGRSYLTSLQDYSVDFLCHDVFSGGSSPSLLFSNEFFGIAEKKLKKNGVLTINLLSHLVSGKNKVLKLLLSTLRQHFKHIDGYRDGTISEKYMQNIVLYCTNFEISYRDYNEEDEMGSQMRSVFLKEMKNFKITLEYEDDGFLLTDSNNELNTNSYHNQFEHFVVMNKMVDTNTWIQYE